MQQQEQQQKLFGKLFTILENTEYDIDTPFKKVITEAIEGVGFASNNKQVWYQMGKNKEKLR